MTVDELLATAEEAVTATDEMLVIDPDTRQINLPGVELVFGVESDAQAERKYFYCPRYVGNGLDLASCFIRVNYRNANGTVDAYLVDDMAVTGDGEAITFSWALHRNVTLYKGQVQFVVCCNRPGGNGVPAAEWNTTVTTGIVLAGLEPDGAAVEAATSDAIAALLAKVDAQSANVEAVGAREVAEVTTEGKTQVGVVQTASETAEAAAVAEIEAKGVNVRASIPDDYTALGEAVRTIERGMAPGIVCEVEGTAVAVSDASNQAMRGLRIFGRSTQNGVPTPDAPVEIVSVEKPVVTVAGRNLCPESAFDTMSANGTTNIYDATTHTITLTEDTTGNPGRYIQPYKQMVVGEPYTISFDIRGTSGKVVHCGWDKKKVLITLTSDFVRYSATVIATNTKEPVVFYGIATSAGGLGAGEYMQFANVQIEAGSVANSYEPYKPVQTVPIAHTLPGIPVASGGNYTDSDGQQWISDEVDLERGVYVQHFKVVTLTGDENWVQDTNYSCTYRVGAGHIAIGGISTHYHTYVRTEDIGSVSGVYLAYTVNHIITDPRFVNDLAGFKAFLANEYSSGKPVTVIRRLAEPIETPLSETEIAAYRALHTNKPNTTILNDSGAHMAVAYTADTKLYIDNLLKE